MVPFTGLGLYNGFRGNNWLRNRIKVFEQFVVPSLLAQTSKEFILWICWRKEERLNPLVQELAERLKSLPFRVVHTYSGIPFWDDKYPDDKAYDRLVMTLHYALTDLRDAVEDTKHVLMTIQPSDDCYNKDMVAEIQKFFDEREDAQAFGYRHGYVSQYQTKALAEYNPITNPPFFTIKFTKQQFLDPLTHMKYTGPYKSHEYVGNFLKYYVADKRGFIVGTHASNISTVYDHPFRGRIITGEESESILDSFGIKDVEKLQVPFHLGSALYRSLPYAVKRKIRFWAGEKKWILRPFFAIIYRYLLAQ